MKLKEIAHNVTKVTRAESDLWLLPSQLVALEVEVENCRFGPKEKEKREPLLDFWTIENDGSLRNSGVELVSGPQYGMDLLEAISALETGLPPQVIWSLRTSVHVHLDVREWNMDQLLAMIYMYIVLEYVLFSMSPNRRNNQYCVPWFCSGATEVALVLHTLRKRGSLRDLNDALSTLYRYSACNLKAIQKFATVEFRHMHGTNNAMELVNWVNVLMGLIKVGNTCPSSYVLTCLSTTQTTLILLKHIYGPYYKLLSETEDYAYNLNQGFKSLQNILFMLEEQFEKEADTSQVDIKEHSSYAMFRKKKLVPKIIATDESIFDEARIIIDDGENNEDDDEDIREEEDRDNDDNGEGNDD